MSFRRVAILGTGLIGGSFGLALRRASPMRHLVGWDRPEVLPRAMEMGAISKATPDFSAAVRDADLVVMALPIAGILDLLPRVAREAAPQALVTDVGSTKTIICRAACLAFAGEAHFLGGHPIAGKEAGGIEHADADLFRNAPWVLVGAGADRDARERDFEALVESLGARPVWLDAEAHDRALAIVSHLPQLAAIALAGVARGGVDETGLPLSLAGPGMRDFLRLAGSPYSVWRDICLTNRENIVRALEALSQALEHLSANLATEELRNEFAAASDVYKKLREMQ